MLRVKVKFLICLQINFKTYITVFVIKKKEREDMNALLNEINDLVITKSDCPGQCMYNK